MLTIENERNEIIDIPGLILSKTKRNVKILCQGFIDDEFITKTMTATFGIEDTTSYRGSISIKDYYPELCKGKFILTIKLIKIFNNTEK